MNNPARIAHKISVIIPTYLEALNIPILVDGIIKSIAANDTNEYEIIVVDDNSPDDTREVCRILTNRYPTFKLITRVSEKGLATAIYRGIKEASGDILITMDADLSHDPTIIPLLVNEILNNSADVVIASRFIKGAGMHSTFNQTLGSKALNNFIRVVLQLHVKDCTGGFHAIRKDNLKNLDMDSIFRGYGDYSIALLHAGHKRGFKIKEIAFKYHPRKNGSSKTRLMKTGFSYGIRTMKLRVGME